MVSDYSKGGVTQDLDFWPQLLPSTYHWDTAGSGAAPQVGGLWCVRQRRGVGVYRPRQPQETPFYKLVERFYLKTEEIFKNTNKNAYSNVSMTVSANV